jgi:hypothetical protein
MEFDGKKVFQVVSIIIIIILTFLIVFESLKTQEVTNDISTKSITDKRTENYGSEVAEENKNFEIISSNFEPNVEQPTEETKEEKEEKEILENDERRDIVDRELGDEENQSTEILEPGEVEEVISIKKKIEKEIIDFKPELEEMRLKRKERNLDNKEVPFDLIRLSSLKNKEVKNRELIDKGLILVYWNSYQDKTVDFLKKWEMAKEIEGINIEFVNIGSGVESPRTVIPFLEENDIAIDTFMDNLHSIKEIFGTKENLKVYFLNKDGYLMEESNTFDENVYTQQSQKLIDFYEENKEEITKAEELLDRVENYKKMIEAK